MVRTSCCHTVTVKNSRVNNREMLRAYNATANGEQLKVGKSDGRAGAPAGFQDIGYSYCEKWSSIFYFVSWDEST